MDRRPQALVVEDDRDVRGLVSELLEAEGFAVEGAATLSAARRALEERPPDLVVLDRALPDGEGLELCRVLRASPATRRTAVLVLTCRGKLEDRVLGLRSGADDYMAKPFHAPELAARARALVRRACEGASAPLETAGIRLDMDRHRCLVEGRPVRLWRTEFELLRIFLERPGRLLTREFLSERVWGHPRVPTSRAVETAVQRLRRRLGSAGSRIETIRGYGFRFDADHPSEG
ncbi:MAG: response regulator transcription factor [Elusimicrobia bacterium]|nr:response regulator transcription factor [Elusimicrobiota bacterium]